ncbi:regulator of chromosome condensation 1/beta-lactamase-inhibitor protein II [Cokeromyces recurvatus]|uniref:regulator of chromosome condensation 1/beta-lactamase-inhibitor protein II n=1 Tax=Cokeromyces recurvatus TaxID=90255 RepID=UPI00221EFD7E|nr:regulator of chromosome condensation 1/beta-lactamase-inhibitor protein II [Cokeromyces recurvatus]KAI7903972.1 regulator of chromosome condensation 1/beta-lactamase-inhibitor protein II [Cokeromyces recurvatus]
MGSFDTHILKEREGGTAYVVGYNQMFDELGIYGIQNVTFPRMIPELEYESIIDIASSSLHTLAINRYGQIWSWGCGEFGALGRSGIESCPRPIIHPSIRHIKFKKVSCGNSISMAITTKGQLYTWGTFRSSKDIYGYLPNVYIQNHPRVPKSIAKLNFIDIASGASHCVALDTNGHVYTWGCNEFCQLGRSTTTPTADEKVEKLKNLTPTQVPLLNDIVSISSGAFHSLALDRFGQVYAWGLNHYQQCGLAEKKKMVNEGMDDDLYRAEPDIIEFPRQIPCFKNKKTIHHTSNNQICIDKNDIKKETMKAPSVNTTTISLIEALRKKIETINIMDQQKTTEEIKIEETDIMSSNENSLTHTLMPTVKSIATGDYHSIALMNDNTIAVWGFGEEDQLGLELDSNFLYPGSFKLGDSDKVNAIGCPIIHPWRCKERITKVVCGANHSLVLSQEGHVWGFGRLCYHQSSILHKDNNIVPTLIDSLTCKVVNASAGETYSIFIMAEDIDVSTL